MRAAWTGVAVVLTVMLGIAGGVLWPTDTAGYNDRQVAAADGTLSALRTLVVAHDAEGISPYRRVLVEDARKDVATSLHDVTLEEPLDPESVRARNELLPLLVEASTLVSDPDPIDANVDRLRDLGDRLSSYVEGHR